MPPSADAIQQRIHKAARTIAHAWPLHSFIAANPLTGLEEHPFPQAIAKATQQYGAQGYPSADTFRRALDEGRIDPAILTTELEDRGIHHDPRQTLEEITPPNTISHKQDPLQDVDRILSKWLAAFLDEGQAAWPMPDRDKGFYTAWRHIAPYDKETPRLQHDDLHEDPFKALQELLQGQPATRWDDIFEHHLTALPGWTSFIHRRSQANDDPWQTHHPITLTDYLAVRLTLTAHLGLPLAPSHDDEPDPNDQPIAEAWLKAWEETYRRRLLETLQHEPPEGNDQARPEAQLVFCIDTRSEILRRHLEAAGPIETHGYAGFFGLPIRFQPYEEDTNYAACPPILTPQHHIHDEPKPEPNGKDAYDRKNRLIDDMKGHFEALKNDLVAAFPFVEGSGSAYGATMAARTLLPRTIHRVTRFLQAHAPPPDRFCSPNLSTHPQTNGSTPKGIPFEAQVDYAEAAFQQMGWDHFARLVVFTGHRAQTQNNPFNASLHCGACAGNPGGANARTLAKILNDEHVQTALQERGITIPEHTYFLAAEHNTTTDEVTLYDEDIPESHEPDIERLRENLATARQAAAQERAATLTPNPKDGTAEVERRAADWAQTRPEWGLAGNASFIIGPRKLTKGRNLQGRAFLHSYDWTQDEDGSALEAIMTGPLILGQWINTHYYFATVDNAHYGSGSKTTQNPVGKVGVLQGNGGDLMTGLPLQSVTRGYGDLVHQPLRLTTIIHAPAERVESIVQHNEGLSRLLENEWLRVTILDPTQDGEAYQYDGEQRFKRVPLQSAR